MTDSLFTELKQGCGKMGGGGQRIKRNKKQPFFKQGGGGDFGLFIVLWYLCSFVFILPSQMILSFSGFFLELFISSHLKNN